jgi:hypothetical protein
MSAPDLSGENPLLRYGDVVQFGVQDPATQEIAWGEPAVVFGGNQVGQMEAFPVITSTEGDAQLITPEPMTPTAEVRRFGRMSLWQVREALLATVDPWDRQAAVTDYTSYKHYKDLSVTIESTLHDETTPYLTEERAEIAAVLENLDEVNRRLAEAGRPDLAMGERAEMQPVNTPEDLATKNNFAPNLLHLGIHREGEPQYTTDPLQANLPWENLRMPTDEEFQRLSSIAGLPQETYDEAIFGETDLGPGMAGFPANELMYLKMATHLDKKSFGRMITLFPDFTRRILADCMGRHPQDRPDDVLIAAYQVMAQLVDTGDSEVMRKKNGADVEAVDDWYLAR